MNSNNSEENNYDVIVIGGGPGGSTTAAYLGRMGYKIALIERESFPRYHVGESLTGMAAEIIEDFALEDQMEEFKFPIKGGVKVLGKEAKSEFFVAVLRQTWQVRRDEFDKMLLDNALKHHVHLIKGAVRDILFEGGKTTGVNYTDENDSTKTLKASYIVDASGSSTLLSKKGIAGKQEFTNEFEKQVAVFTQFKNVKRDPGAMRDNTFLFYSDVNEWAWFIPLSEDTVSIGVVMPNEKIKSLGGIEAAMKWGLENINPDLTSRMSDAEQIEEIRAIRKYSYIIEPFVGNGWLCVGDSHRFSDPIFSFGVSFALVEARAAAHAISQALETGSHDTPFEEYAKFCDTGQNAAFDVIRYFWHFPVFFGFQAKGKYRKDIIRLLSSDCHKSEEIEILKLMRESLEKEDAKKSMDMQEAIPS